MECFALGAKDEDEDEDDARCLMILSSNKSAHYPFEVHDLPKLLSSFLSFSL